MRAYMRIHYMYLLSFSLANQPGDQRTSLPGFAGGSTVPRHLLALWEEHMDGKETLLKAYLDPAAGRWSENRDDFALCVEHVLSRCLEPRRLKRAEIAEVMAQLAGLDCTFL